jgi:SAM-dependent methyltransferase
MPETPSYEYRGLKAQAWDLLRGDYSTWPDRPFYLDAIRRYGEPALDVGCGTGRLLLDYLAQGIDCDGVDNSPEMLALCRDKAAALGLQPHLYEQRMEALDLPRGYATIFVPSSSFLLLTDPSDAERAMRRFFKHLLPGGALVMPFMVLWPGETVPAHNVWSRWYVTGEATRPDDGARVRRSQRARYDMAQQLEDVEDRYEVILEGATVQQEEHLCAPATRWYTFEQSLAEYARAGFADVHVVLEFTDEAAQPGDRIWTVFGTRPDPTAPA